VFAGFAFFIATTLYFIARIMLGIGHGRTLQVLATLINGITALV
jgi:hypothetical protein